MSELKKILSAGKGITLDFVENAENKLVIASILAGFANTEGGKLIIGIKDSTKVIGISPTDELAHLEEIASAFCDPIINIVSNTIQDDRHLVLEITVPKSEFKHKTKDDDNQWKFYHRINEHTLVGNRIVIQLWKLQSEGKAKPEKLSQEMNDLKELIDVHEPVSVSRLFRLSSINKNEINLGLASLMYWHIVDCAVVDSIIVYTLRI